MIAGINALNDGKGFGVRSGATEARFFFKLNFTSVTYEPGEMETDGRAKAMELFPKLDMIVGMGDKCSDGDGELVKFAEIADGVNKMYFTTRGPSAILKSEPLKKHFFSTHLNSDEYPATSMQQFSLRGLKNCSVLWEDSGNAFFEGVGFRAVELAEALGFGIQVKQQIEINPEPDLAMVEQSIRWAIGNRSEVLILSLRNPVFFHVLDLLHAARTEHVFSGVWAVNVPWGNNCAGAAEFCSYVVGAAQMSNEEVEVYRDGLLGLTYPEFEASSFFVPIGAEYSGTQFWDVASMASVFVQAVQQFYRFRPLAHENFLSDAAEYEALRAYMREGSLIGNTFAGPMLFTDSGSNGGRSASTLQTAGTGVAKLIFPADIARAGFVFPAPGSEQCPFNFYREYTGADCPLCRHQCLLCRDGSEWIDTEVCGCSKGYWSEVIVVGQGCEECPGRAVCDGRYALPYPQVDTWGDPSVPEEFFECKSQRCAGGPQFACEDGFAGIMCEGTQEGWYSFGTGVRVKCPAKKLNQILLHTALITAVLLIFFLLNRVLASRFDSIDLFLDSMQRLAIVSNFWLRWPEEFAPLFTLLEIVLLDADLARPDCVMSWNFFWSFWVQKMLLVLLFALIVVPVLFGAWRCKLKHNVSWKKVLTEPQYSGQDVNRAIRHCIDMLLMMYPTLAKNTLDTFTCRKLGQHHYLVADPNFQCYSGNHLGMVIVSALLQPIFVFALPFGSLYFLIRNTRHQTLHKQVNLDRYGVLYARYEPPYLWWEGWRTVQKLLLVAIQVLLWRWPLLQANMALLLFLLGLASHYYAQPYASPVLDGMDSASYFFACLFTMVGISYYSSDFHWRQGLYVLTLVGLGLFALVAVVMSYFDVREHIASQKAATMVKAAAKKHFARLSTEAEQAPAEARDRRGELKRAGTSASLNQLMHEADEGLDELPSTLDGHVFKRWTDTVEVTLEAYHSLKRMDEWLTPYVSDQSPTSQFSLLPDANFFREVNTVFPNFFTWIRRASQEDMQHIQRLFGSILAGAEEEDLGFQAAIVPGDQSSVLYWLINVANTDERETFFTTLEELIAAQPVRRKRAPSTGDVESTGGGFFSSKFASRTSSVDRTARPTSQHASPTQHAGVASYPPRMPSTSNAVSPFGALDSVDELTDLHDRQPSAACIPLVAGNGEAAQRRWSDGGLGDGDRTPLPVNHDRDSERWPLKPLAKVEVHSSSAISLPGSAINVLDDGSTHFTTLEGGADTGNLKLPSPPP